MVVDIKRLYDRRFRVNDKVLVRGERPARPRGGQSQVVNEAKALLRQHSSVVKDGFVVLGEVGAVVIGGNSVVVGVVVRA